MTWTGRGGRGSEGVEVIHWTIGKFSEWSMASSHLGKVFKTKETVERSSREMEREGREDLFESRG